MMAALQSAEIEGEPWQGSAKLNVCQDTALCPSTVIGIITRMIILKHVVFDSCLCKQT
jgi:hypothetical protein